MTDILKFGNISSEEAIQLEEQYGAHNYNPLPVVLAKGEGFFFGTPKAIVITTSSAPIPL